MASNSISDNRYSGDFTNEVMPNAPAVRNEDAERVGAAAERIIAPQQQDAHEIKENEVAPQRLERSVKILDMADNNSGSTPLHLAVLGGHVNAVRLLINYKARVDLKNDNGLTPLDIALEKNHAEIADLLKQYQ
ncbi:MAG: ankyrin repeat domain-containing protein [Waddliaceae bacterium]